MKIYVRTIINKVRTLFSKGFKIVNGRYGPRVVLTGAWAPEIGKWMQRRGVTELECNYLYGCKLDGSCEFLKEIPFLTGIRIVNQNLRDLSPLSDLPALRSLELSHVPRPRGLQFSVWNRLEQLNIEWFPGAEELFGCKSINQLSIGLYPGKLGSKRFRELWQLEELCLSGGGLEEIEFFNALDSLQRLQLINLRHLRSLRGIEDILLLRCIRLDGCSGIRSIEQVRKLINLELLWFVDCGEVQSLDPVRNLTKLKSLLFGGSTNIVDGDLTPLLGLPELCHWGFASDLKHYNIDSDDPYFVRRRKDRKCRNLNVDKLWQG